MPSTEYRKFPDEREPWSLFDLWTALWIVFGFALFVFAVIGVAIKCNGGF